MPRYKNPKQKSQFDWVGDHFASFQKNGSGYKACCPLHDDKTPSLSIREGNDGRILVHCHAGCPTDSLLEVVGLTTADLMPGAKRIVATYDYYDEQGTLLYQSVRREPKGFMQRRPKEGGGYEWSTKDVRRVLYKLPQLIKSDVKQPVFIGEGEKDVDRLSRLGFTATTNVGGAGKWQSAYNEFLEGRDVVIIPDNDTPGWEHAREVALSLYGTAKSIKILEFPDLPDKGDVSDWLNAGGTTAKLLALAKRAPTYRPPTHRAIGSKNAKGSDPSGAQNAQNLSAKPDGKRDGLGPVDSDPVPDGPMGRVAVEPFPIEALPRLLQRFVVSVSEALPCPIDFPATMMLPVLATCIGCKRRVEIKPSWRENAVLWVACVARSGERKTPAFEIVTEPLRERQQILLAQYLEQKRAYKALPPEKKAEQSLPRLKQVLTTDTTIEALKEVLTQSPDGIAYPADELSGWARSIGQYKSGRGDDRQNWLSFWSSTQIVCNRRSIPEPIVINHPFVCVTGGIQPDALPDVIDDSREDGFSARVLFAWPNPIPNNDWTEAAIKQSIDYHSICEQLFDLPPTKEPVRFSDAAKRLWIEWVNSHRHENPADNLRPMWAKAEGHCARLALILHLTRQLCNETRSAAIDEPSIAGAVKLIEYFKGHARRVYSQLAVATGKDRIPKALRWVCKHGGTVTARQARMNGFTKDADEAKQLFHDLEELGYGAVVEGKQGNVTFQLQEAPQCPR